VIEIALICFVIAAVSGVISAGAWSIVIWQSSTDEIQRREKQEGQTKEASD
jgi:hypothetical protein